MIDAARIAHLRRIAEAAAASSPQPWEPYFTVHGDPYVVEAGGGGLFGQVAKIDPAPEDYGRSVAIFVGTFDPITVLAILTELERR